MKYRFFLLVFSAITLFLHSCASLEMPEYRGNEDIKFQKIEGKKVQFEAGATVYNPNWFGVKIKPSKFDVYIENDFVGTVQLKKKVKMKSKRETALMAPFEAELADGVFAKAFKYAGKQDLNVRLKGKAKAGVFLFSKKVEIDKTISVPSSKLLKGGGGLGGFKLN